MVGDSDGATRMEPARFSGVEQEMLYTPAHPALSLERAEPTTPCPHINAALSADLCGVTEQVPVPRAIRRDVRPLSIELAAAEAEPVVLQARFPLVLTLIAPLLAFGRRRDS